MRTAKFVLSVLIPAALFLPSAFASSVTWYYTGNDFTSATNGLTTSDYITGQITFDSSDSGEVPSFTSWSFGIDGNNTFFTNQNMDASSDGDLLSVDLDPNGNISSWYIELGVTEFYLSTANQPQYNYVGDSFGTWGNYSVGSNANDAGTWSMAQASAPEPGTALLLSVALGGIFVMRRRISRRCRRVFAD